MNKRGLWITGLVCFVVLAMPSAAATTIATKADGHTHLTNSDCTIWMDWPNNETIRLQSDPDTLKVPMDIQWFDERSANSPNITHHFHMNTTYGGSPFSNDAYKYSTGGMGSPSTGGFYMDVSGVAKSTTMWVYYSVIVTYTQSGNVLCSGDNMGENPHITFRFV